MYLRMLYGRARPFFLTLLPFTMDWFAEVHLKPG